MDSAATGWSPADLSAEEFADGEAYHRSLYADGDLASPLGWHRDSIAPLVESAMQRLHDGAKVVDYGSGTGGSAIELLKACDAAGISIELTLVDPLSSWFSRAHSLLSHRSEVRFELSLETDGDGRRCFRSLDHMLRGETVDLILCSSTLHLIPPKALGGLLAEMYNALVPGGTLVWSSGDIVDASKPDSRVLLHDPYRGVRARLRVDPDREAALARLDEQARIRCERGGDAIFPSPPGVEVLLAAVSACGFSSELSTHEIQMSRADAERFILVPRLAEVAAPLPAGVRRDDLIKAALASTFSELESRGQADREAYRIHWTYGVHQRS